MAIITITIVPTKSELIAGIPQEFEIYTNAPATIFYTFDGTEPTTSSSVYTTALTLGSESSYRLRVLALSGSHYGVLDYTFSSNQGEKTGRNRRVPGESGGIVVDAYGTLNKIIDGYGIDTLDSYDGYWDGYNWIDGYVIPSRNTYDDYLVVQPARFNDGEDYDFQQGTTGPSGIGPGAAIITEVDPDFLESASAFNIEASTPNNNIYFNPNSLYIVVDGREDNLVVPVINKPYSIMRNLEKFGGGREYYNPNPYLSGSLVRMMYDEEREVVVFYYFDGNEGRWIKSIQSLPQGTIPKGLGQRKGNIPLIFKWVYNKQNMI